MSDSEPHVDSTPENIVRFLDEAFRVLEAIEDSRVNLADGTLGVPLVALESFTVANT